MISFFWTPYSRGLISAVFRNSFSLLKCKSAAIAIMWIEFVREVRLFWDEGDRLPRMALDAPPDPGTCLIHQKLQLVWKLHPVFISIWFQTLCVTHASYVIAFRYAILFSLIQMELHSLASSFNERIPPVFGSFNCAFSKKLVKTLWRTDLRRRKLACRKKEIRILNTLLKRQSIWTWTRILMEVRRIIPQMMLGGCH